MRRYKADVTIEVLADSAEHAHVLINDMFLAVYGIFHERLTVAEIITSEQDSEPLDEGEEEEDNG